MQKHTGIIIIFISIAVILVAGCTNSAPSPTTSTPTVTPSVTQLVVQTTLISTISIPNQTQTLTTNMTTKMITFNTTPNQPTTIKYPDPYIQGSQVTKNYFFKPISNCPMQEIFPSIAKDPNYGIKQPVPKLTAISAGEFNVFLRDYTEGKNENTKIIGVSRCQGAIVNPYWNFIRTDLKLIPTNSRPTNYTITINVHSQGKIIAQFNTTEVLTLEELIGFTSYIPMKSDEMDLIDSIDFTFTQRPN